MDKGLLTTILLIAFLYIVPELFKRLKGEQKKYQYPHLPEKKQTEIIGKKTIQSKNKSLAVEIKEKVRKSQDDSIKINKEVIYFPHKETVKQNFVNKNDVVKGIVWSIILEKPLTKRRNMRY